MRPPQAQEGRGRRPWQGPGRSGRLGAHARTCQRQGGLGATQPGPLRPSPPSQPQKATLKGANYEHKCHDAGKAGDHGRGRAGRAPARGHARGRDPPGPRSQGLSPPRRSQTAIPLPKQELTPKRAPSAIQQLTATAASAEAVLDARLDALRKLLGKLRDPAAEMGSPGMLMSLWNRMLSLLADPSAPVRQAAAPVVGCIGALASKQSSRAGVPPGLLFDWAIPLMTAYAEDGTPDSEGSAYWALSGLQHGLPGCDGRTLTRYGNALLDTCQRLLEADALSEHLLPMLLRVIAQVAGAEHSFRAHFQDLVELIVGWSFEPKLTDAQRSSIFDTLASFGPMWTEKQPFAGQLLSSLLADADRSASRDSSELLSLEEQYSLLAYVGCSSAIIQACGPSCSTDLPRAVQRICRAASAGMAGCFSAAPSSSSISAVQQLCSSLLRLYKAVIPSLAASKAGNPRLSGTEQQAAASSTAEQPQQQRHQFISLTSAPLEHAEQTEPGQQQQQADKGPNSPQQAAEPEGVQSAHLAVLSLTLQACEACPSARRADLGPVLTLYLQACQALREAGQSIPAQAVEAFLRSPHINALDSQGGAALQDVILQTASIVLRSNSASHGQHALMTMLAHIAHCLDQTAAGSVRRVPHYQMKLLMALLRDGTMPHAATAVWDALHKVITPQNFLSQCHGDWRAILTLLAEASAKVLSQRAHGSSRHLEIRAFWLALAQQVSAPDVSIAALQWLVQAASDSHSAATQDRFHSASGEQGIVYRLARLQLTTHDERVLVRIASSEESRESHQEHPAAAQSFAAAAVAAAALLSTATHVSQRMAASQAALQLLQPDKHLQTGTPQQQDSQLRPAASSEPSNLDKIPSVAEAESMFASSSEAVLEDDALVQLCHMAVRGLSDVSAEVAASWRQVLDAMAASITRITSNASRSSLSAFLLLHKVQPSRSAQEVHALQGEALEPQQLSRMLDWVTQASPAILIRSQASASSAEAGANRKDAEMREWICQVALSKGSISRPLTSSAEAVDWAAEVAAKQLVAQRLRTHYGGAVQTLAALEKGLLSRLSKCKQTREHRQHPPGLFGGSALLSLALALERHIQSACFGALALPSAVADAESQSFFAAPRNRTACTGWFERLRPSLLKLASALSHHAATVYHGQQHLLSLQRQMEHVLASGPCEDKVLEPPNSGQAQPKTAQQAGRGAQAQANGPSAAVSQIQAKQSRAQQHLAVPVKAAVHVKAALPARILRRSTASEGPETAASCNTGSRTPATSHQQASESSRQPQPEDGQHGQPAETPGAGGGAAARRLPPDEKLLHEVADTLWMACSALVALGLPDDIDGLHAFAQTAFFSLLSRTQRYSSHWSWMKGMEAEASGNLEAAAEKYTASIQEIPAADMRERVKRRLASIYASLGDYDALSSVAKPGAPVAFMQALVSDQVDVARQAAESMSQWGQDGSPTSEHFASSTDQITCQTLAHIVIPRHSSKQPPADTQRQVQPISGDSGSSRTSSGRINQRPGRSSAAEKQPDTGPAARASAQPQGPVLEALQAEVGRLHAAASLHSSEGLQAVAPMIADLCILQEHMRVLDQLGSARQSSPGMSCGLVELLPCMRTGALDLGQRSLLVGYSNGWQNVGLGRAHAGARIALVRPGLCLEQLYRAASAQSLAAGHTHAAVQQQLLVASADSAMCAGNFRLAQKLLDRVAVIQPAPAASALGQVTPGAVADFALTAAQLQLRLHALTGQSDSEDSAAELLKLVHSGAASVAARAQARLLLLRLRLSAQHQSTGLPSQEATQTAIATEDLFQRALPVARQGPASSGHAWRLYGDWLWQDTPDEATVGAAESAPEGNKPSVRLRAAEAYCQAARNAAGSGDVGGTMSALLRVIKASEELSAEAPEARNRMLRAAMAVPPLAWQLLTPQLFSLLAQDKAFARRLAAGVLSMLSTLAPSAMLYPALAAMGRDGAVRASEEMQQVLAPLKARHEGLLQEAGLFVQHLKEIACLWSEQWMHILRDLQAEIGKHSKALGLEAAHMKRLGLSEEEITQRLNRRWEIATGPIYGALDSVSKATIDQQPSTPYQVALRRELAQHIQKAVTAFRKTASKGFSFAAEAQGILKGLLSVVEHQCRPCDMPMEVFSPQLSKMEGTTIPMMSTATSAACVAAAQPTIASIQNRMKVLGTKTRPKRLWVIGSDGHCQSLLLKGREDLHLDERLMQMLRSANTALRADELSAYRALHVRTFAVVPLGPKTGLIEWVDLSAPLFSIYQAWQRRSAPLPGRQSVPENPTPAEAEGHVNPAQKLPSPTEAFYRRLLRALKEAGVNSSASRDKWPLEVLKKVLQQLQAEIPRQLLARELFCSAGSTAEWLQRQRAYASSTAVMSMIGWLLGLGDRHLDNILLDSSSGEVVHIDFNVVFDQGLRLRVPEIVPFRLTQMLKSALGVTGIEGTFRAAMEATLHALRCSSTAQSELLASHCQEASLIWNAAHHVSALAKESGLAVTLRLLGMRSREAAQRLLPVLAPAAEALRKTSQQLAAWLLVHKEASAATEQAQAANVEAARLQAAIVVAQSRHQEEQGTLGRSRAAEQQMQADLVTWRANIEQALRECRSWSERHLHTTKQLRDGASQELQLSTHFWLSSNCRAPLGLVTSLTGAEADSVLGCVNWAGQAPSPDLLGRCAAVDEKAAVLFSQRDQALLSTTAVLLEYSAALQQILPGNYAASSQHAKWSTAFAASLTAQTESLQAEQPSIEHVQALFSEAWQSLQRDLSPPDALMGHRALHISAQLAQQACAAAEGLIPALAARVPEAEQEGSTAQVALAEHVKGLGPDKGHMALSAVLSTLLSELQGIVDGIGQPDPLWTVKGLLRAGADAIQMVAPAEGEAVNMGPLLDLVREADEHAAAAALVEVAVAPDLASCAAAGLNYTHRQEARAMERLYGGVTRLEAQGQAQDSTELATARASLADQFRSLMSGAAESSLMLKPLSHLTHIYGPKEAEGDQSWSSTVTQIDVMDNLLRACFAPPPAPTPAAAARQSPADSASPSQQAPAASEQSAEGRMAHAHTSYCARRLARSACTVLTQLLRSMLGVQHGSWAAAGQGLGADGADEAQPFPELEASAKLEAADEHLNRLGQAGSDADSFGQADDWLMEEAQQQGSQKAWRNHESQVTTRDEAQLDMWSEAVPERVSESEQQDDLLQSLLDFDEDPETRAGPYARPQAGEMHEQMPLHEQHADQPLPAFFGAPNEDAMALEGLLLEAQSTQGSATNHHPDDLEGDSGQPKGNMSAFFQPNEGTALPDSLELEPQDACRDASLQAQATEAGPLHDQPVSIPGEAQQNAAAKGGVNSAPGNALSEPGEGTSLDVGGQRPSGTPAASQSHEMAMASQESTLSGIFRPLTPAAAGEQHPLQAPSRSRLAASQHHAEHGTSPEVREALLAMRRAASARAQLAALSQALQQAEGLQHAKARAISQYEWMHEAVLEPAGVLGPPVQLTQQGGKGWQLQRRRRELLEALDQSIRHLLSLEEPLGSWAAHSAQAEAALAAAAESAGGPVTAPLRHFLQLRAQWLGISGDHVASLARAGQAVLHLELSREGRAWVSPSGISGSCEGYVPLLERLQRTCIARLAAACEAERCTLEMCSLSAELSAAQPALEAAQAAEDAAVATFARCTPGLLKEAVAVKQHLTWSLMSADKLKVELSHMHMVVADLRLMSAQDAMPTDAFEETVNSTLASHSQLKSALPAAVAQLRPLLAVLPSSDAAGQVRPRPRGQPPLPSAEAMRRAADLVAAAASLMPAAESQVALTQQAGEAAAALLQSIPTLQAECSAGSSMPLAVSPEQAFQTGEAADGRAVARCAAQAARTRARQEAHAAHVHDSFMRKLMGIHGGSSRGVSPLPSSTAAAGVALGGVSGVKEGAPQGAAHQELEGGVFEQREGLSVKEQVQVLVEEATSLDNLAQMYEGWSAWI